jgi:uncharacterized lipoprotein YmbA
MTTPFLTRRRLLAGFGVAALVGACAESPPPRMFTLASRPSAAPASEAIAMRILVKPVEVAKYLDRTQIVRYSDPYELKIADLERWGEGMRDMTTRILIENLSLRLPRCQIVSSSSPVSLHADATLEIDLSRLDADSSGEIVLDARWAVQRDGRPLVVQLARIRVRPMSNSITDLVAAMSDALGQLSDQIALGVVA